MPFIITQGTMVHFIPVNLTLLPGCNQLMIKQLVMPLLITLSGWSRSLLLIGMDVMILAFKICLVVSSWYAVPLTFLVTDSFL